MWALKIRGFDKGNIYGSKTLKHQVSMQYYPINYYIEKSKYYFMAIGFVEGAEENINAFFKELKKDNKLSKNRRWVMKLETEGNFFICITCQNKSLEVKQFVRLFYNPKIIHLAPAVIDTRGYEERNMASINRKEIEKLIKISEKKYNAKVLSIKEMKIKNLGILSILPPLTEKQKRAYLLAVENGYYDYPRKIKLEKLAKLMKISLSTYQEHLRKAEFRLLPFISKKYF